MAKTLITQKKESTDKISVTNVLFSAYNVKKSEGALGMIEETKGVRMVQIQVMNMFNICEQRNLNKDQLIVMVRACIDASAMFLTLEQINKVEEDFRFRLQRLEYKNKEGVGGSVFTY